MSELPRYKGYTVDERLGEFRKVTWTDGEPSMETVTFESAQGQRLIAEMVNAEKDTARQGQTV